MYTIFNTLYYYLISPASSFSFPSIQPTTVLPLPAGVVRLFYPSSPPARRDAEGRGACTGRFAMDRVLVLDGALVSRLLAFARVVVSLRG
jgi:hypothetical protein